MTTLLRVCFVLVLLLIPAASVSAEKPCFSTTMDGLPTCRHPKMTKSGVSAPIPTGSSRRLLRLVWLFDFDSGESI